MVNFSERDRTTVLNFVAMLDTLEVSPETAPDSLVTADAISDTMALMPLTAELNDAVATVRTCKALLESPCKISPGLAKAVRTACKAVAKTTARALTASTTALLAVAMVATTDPVTA